MQAFDWEKAPLNKNMLLEASAGTGKTYTMERLVLRMVTEREIPLSSILVVTFTNPAAREMQDRIRELFVKEYKVAKGKKRDLLHRAILDFDRAAIYTIHGFCAHVLQSWPFESGVPLGTSVGQEDNLTDQALRDWFRTNSSDSSPFITEGYRASYKESKGFENLLSSISELIHSDRLNGQNIILPNEQRESLVKEICQEGSDSNLFKSLLDLSQQATLLNSEIDVMNLFKQDGLGKGLGPKKALDFHSLLRELSSLDNITDLLLFFVGRGKSLYSRLIDTFDPAQEGASPLTKAFLDLSLAIDQMWEGVPPQELYKSLAMLFNLQVARSVISQITHERISRGELSFNDLIDVVHSALVGPQSRPVLKEALSHQYRVLFVDEFQDTDQRQWDIFSTIFSKKTQNYFLIGDPKQSIYRFRGADLQVYLRVRESLPKESLYRLDVNYRSHPQLVDGFNTLFSPLFGSTGRPGSIGYAPVGAGKESVPLLQKNGEDLPPIEFLPLGEEGGEDLKSDQAVDLYLNRVADHILSLLTNKEMNLEGRPVRPSDVAVLLEKNKLCLQLQNLLSDRQIPALIFQERDIFQTRELDFISLFLKSLENRDRGESLRQLLLSPVMGLSPRELLFLEEKGFLDSLILEFRIFREKVDRGDLIGQFYQFCSLDNLAHPLLEGGVIPRERALLLGENLMVRILREQGGERRFTNIRHILEILHQEQQQKRLNTEELCRYMAGEVFRKHSEEAFQMRLDQEGEGVQLMTLHSSKGLQFPLVYFCGGLFSQILQTRSSYLTFDRDGKTHCDFLKNKENEERSRLDAWEEKKRLYYVALTRAESKLYMPLFHTWSNCWLNWFYLNLTKKEGEFNPFVQGRFKYDGPPPRKALEELIMSDPQFGLLTEEDNSSVRPYGVREPEELIPPHVLNLNLYKRYPSLVSFSSLINTFHKNEEKLLSEEVRSEADYDLSGADNSDLDETEEVTPATISGGAQLGNLVHSIFEDMDYSLCTGSLEAFQENQDAETLMKERALYYFKSDWYDEYSSILKEMVWNTLASPLVGFSSYPTGRELPPSLSLLTQNERLHELEFLIKIKEKGKIKLKKFITHTKEGYIKGFIDLIFLYKGQYYMADWKTTRALRGEKNPYDTSSLEGIMDKHDYHLQYWIYLTAFYLHQKRVGADFSYERDFGGIFYLFNRGMNPIQEGHGIYFNRPTEEELIAFYRDFVEDDHDTL